MNYELRKQIVKGTVADFAVLVAKNREVKEKDLAIILIEIANDLKRSK